MKNSIKDLGSKPDPIRLSVYIYRAQLEAMDEICRTRKKTRRLVFLEAFQTYVGLYREGEI